MKKITLLLLFCTTIFFACNDSASSEENKDDEKPEESIEQVDNQEFEDQQIEEENVEDREVEAATANNTAAGSTGEFYACFADPDTENPTNIRNAPNGKIIYKVAIDKQDYYSFKVVEYRNKWFRIEGGLESAIPDEGVENVELTGDCWVHRSVIGASLIGSIDNPVIRKMPDDNSEIVEKILTPTCELYVRFLDMKNDRVKITYTTEENKTIEGWIPANWICSNPLTTCP